MKSYRIRPVLFVASVAAMLYLASPGLAGADPEYLDVAVSANGTSVWEFRYDNVEQNTNEAVFGGSGFQAIQQVEVAAGDGSLSLDYAAYWNPMGSGLPGASAFVYLDYTVHNHTSTDQLLAIDATMLFGTLGNGNPAETRVDHTGEVSGVVEDTDRNGFASLSAFEDTPIYEAFVDGVSAATLYDRPQTWATTEIGGSEDILLASFDEDGDAPNPSQNQLRLRYTYVISPGDSATLSGFYLVSEGVVPGPAAMALLCIAATPCRRRRTS